MTDENPPAGIDRTRPSIARVYDYWLGGKDNFESDREMGWRMAEVNPALPRLVRHNREFICAAVARAAAAGIGQFLDLGSGLPAHPAVHEAVREVIPDARVCYVDIDPVAVLHGEVLLASGAGLAAVRADLTHPETVLADPLVRRQARGVVVPEPRVRAGLLYPAGQFLVLVVPRRHDQP